MENIFITYEKALAILAEQKQDFTTIIQPLASCTGAFLAEDLMADRDFPPFDRVTMDGIAINYTSFRQGAQEFKIEQIAPAGTPQVHLSNSSHCIEVMTGAMLPKNTDTVIRYEDIEITKGIAKLRVTNIRESQNVHFQGMDIPKGSLVVRKGCRISSAEINIAASVGKAALRVTKLPSVVIVSTGDELVDVDETPMPHQIRRSNVYGIQNTLREWGLPTSLKHLPDHKTAMLKEITDLLENFDVLLFTGGVSKGKFDHLPDVLAALNVKRNFHKIQQRPGKPFWFGNNAAGKKIFALPGNPVSSFVCVYAYFRFWLIKSLGIKETNTYVKLAETIQFKPNLVYFPEATIENNEKGELWARAVLGNGSGDFANLVKTDGFLVLPQDKTIFKKGETYPFISYRLKL